MIPNKVEVVLKSEVFKNFRCQVAANSLDIDVEKKSIHHLLIENINIPEDWNIGVIYGASGSGKTTLAKELFGQDCFENPLDNEDPILNQFDKKMSYQDCVNSLVGVGLSSVPCWLRPVKTLSNGQKARAEAALLMNSNNSLVLIDEWTSVVDRTVGKAMSVCINKHAKRSKKQIILLSCHKDIIEWVNPDWMIDCNEQKFILPKSDSFFFRKREQIKFEVRECKRESWKMFSKYHYLNDKLPGGKLYLYGLYLNDNQIGFQCFANYVPYSDKTKKIIYHSNRTVIHPDYVGLGLGIKLINETSKLLYEKIECRIMAKFSSTPVYKAMSRQSCWNFLGQKIKLNKQSKSGNMTRNTGFRDKGTKTYRFLYVHEINE